MSNQTSKAVFHSLFAVVAVAIVVVVCVNVAHCQTTYNCTYTAPMSIACTPTTVTPPVTPPPTAVPIVSLTSPLTFPSQAIGTTSAVAYATLTNTGTATLTISGTGISGPFAWGNLGTCGTTLAAGAKCTYSVVFSPLVAGAATGQITINDNAAGSPHIVTLTGTGGTVVTPPPTPTELTMTTTSLLTGTVGAAYSVPLAATGGTPPYIWSVSTGTLPAGLTLGPATISGIPTAAGSSSIALTVKDSSVPVETVSSPFTLTIAAVAPPPSTGTLASAYAAYLTKYAGYKSVTATPATFSTSMGAPGTVVWLSDGAYNITTRLTTSTSGSSSAHVVYAAVNYDGAKINFTDPGSSNGWPLWYVTGSYVDIVGIDLTTSGTGNGTACGGIGTPGGANYNVFSYNIIHDIPASTAQCGNGSGGGGIVFGSGTSGSTGDMVEGNVITNIGASGNEWTHGVYADGSGFTVRNNVITNSSGGNIQCYHNCQSGSIVNNTLVNGQTYGIVAGSYQTTTMSGMVIANNIVTGSPVGYEECDGNNCGAAGGSNVCTNNNFYNNTAVTKNATCASTITGNPNVNSSGVPAAGSPAIGAGSATYAPATNILGVKVSPPNTGAY